MKKKTSKQAEFSKIKAYENIFRCCKRLFKKILLMTSKLFIRANRGGFKIKFGILLAYIEGQ